MLGFFISPLVVMVPIVALLIGAGANSEVVDAGRDRFPQVTGIDLEGRTIALPAAFDAPVTLVAIGFVQDHQREIDTWIAAHREMAARVPGLAFYEVPVIFKANAALRWWVNNGMRSGIPSTEARQRTVTVYTDQKAFAAAAGLGGIDRAHIVLVTREGRILWRGEGAATPDGIAAAQAAALNSTSK